MGPGPEDPAHGGRPRRAPGGRRGGRLPRPWAARLRADQGRRPAGKLQGLLQGLHEAPRHSDGGVRDLFRPGRGARLRRQARRAHRGQGRRAGRRQGRGRGDDRSGGARGHRLHAAGRQARRDPQRRRRAGGDRGIPAGRGSQLHRHVRRQERHGAGDQPGPQAPAGRRPGPQHRRHGRVFARAGGHARGPCPGHARDHPADHQGHGKGRHPLHRLPVRRPDDRCAGTGQDAGVQLPHGRPGNPADHDAAEVRPL